MSIERSVLVASLTTLFALLVASHWRIASIADRDYESVNLATRTASRWVRCIERRLEFASAVEHSTGFRRIALTVLFPSALSWKADSERLYWDLLDQLRRANHMSLTDERAWKAEQSQYIDDIESRWMVIAAERGAASEWQAHGLGPTSFKKKTIAAAYGLIPYSTNSTAYPLSAGWSGDRVRFRLLVARDENPAAWEEASKALDRYRSAIDDAAIQRILILVFFGLGVAHLLRQWFAHRKREGPRLAGSLEAKYAIPLFLAGWITLDSGYWITDQLGVPDSRSSWVVPYFASGAVTLTLVALLRVDIGTLWRALSASPIRLSAIIGAGSLAFLIDAAGIEIIRHIGAHFDPAYQFSGLLHPYAPPTESGPFAQMAAAVIFDEVHFRGFLFIGIRSIAGLPAAALISSAIFGIVHPANIWTIASATWGGFVYAIAFQRTGSLCVCIIAHLAFNVLVA